MKDKFLFLLLSAGSLYGAPPSRELQDLRLTLNQVDYKLHSHQSEIDLFHERLQGLEISIEKFRQELKGGLSDRSLEKRIASLEKGQDALIADFKTLKTHINETNSAVAQCQSKLSHIDQQLSSDIKSLKHSLQSMLGLLQKEDPKGGYYTVKSGDSLGQIALEHKTDIRTLKQLNNLNSDTIFVGQKIILP